MNLPRREFIKGAVVAGAASLLPRQSAHAAEPAVRARSAGRTSAGFVAPKLETVRWGIIGLGNRGTSTLRESLLLEGSEVRALCDPYEPALRRAVESVAKAGKPAAAEYGDGPEAYKKMLERSDIDAVVICTPWRLHVPMAVAAMKAGKHAFVEVPAAVTIEECWQLVETAENTQRHCMMMENVCYGREELMLLAMCRQNVFGELLHGEAAYLHDLRHQIKDIEHGSGSWRVHEHELRNGNLYPTHGLGPVAQYMSINRGDRFASIVSLSSPSLGIPEYAAANFPPGHPRRTAHYVCGDVNTSIIQTANGRTILVQHNTMSPRPYSRLNVIQGTKGIFAGYPNRIYVEGRATKEHEWDTDLTSWYAEFDHPLWKKVSALSSNIKGMGHGGMDFVMRWRIVQCLREGLPLDQDVYDAASWSAIGPLSEQSVAQRGGPVEVPDFTRGQWRTMTPLGIVS
jgi:predicted dehydrogenase